MLDALAGHDYYRATSPGVAYPALEGMRDVAICIIGGGFAGLATAMSLFERGVRDVLLLEEHRIGHGASGRNGGFVFGGFSLDERPMLAAAGATQARALYRLSLDAVARIRARVQRHAIDCELREEGVYLANWFEDNQVLERRRRTMLDSFGVEWQHVGRAALADKFATQRYSGALFDPGACHFHPLKYAQGLARVLSASGVAVHEHSRAGAIVADGAGWRVSTPRGQVRAREVVLCGGGYLGRLHQGLGRAILPIASYVMVTAPLGQRLQTVLRCGAALYDTRFAFDYYRPLADTRLLWGGRIAVRERSSAQVAALLYRDMLKVYPQLDGVRIDYAWSGLMSYARHKMPVLGRLPDGLWYGSGFGGHGVAPTSVAGEVLAAALCGDNAALSGFASWRLPATFGVAGLAAAQLTYWYYGMRDWMRR